MFVKTVFKDLFEIIVAKSQKKKMDTEIKIPILAKR